MAVRNLRIIVVGPDEAKRKEVLAELSRQQVSILGDFDSYPAIRQLKPSEEDWDVALVELDSDPELCLAVVQNISGKRPASTVMVYSSRDESDLLMRSMWAGAREFLPMPLTSRPLTEALMRATARLMERDGRRTSGRLLVFVGAKGGSGVTTISTNFALALRKEAGEETALLDLDTELGDASLLLGLTPRFTIRDIVRDSKRLDRDLLAGMLERHESGLALVAGPEDYGLPAVFDNGDLTKLLYLMREQFSYVVVDVGPNVGKGTDLLFELAETIYVVSQADVPGLRNAQRYVSHLQRFGAGKLRLVLNRYDHRRQEIGEEQIAKAVGVEVDWKIPNDYSAVKRSHNLAAPLALGDSPVSRVLHQMARATCGKPTESAPKKMRGLFG